MYCYVKEVTVVGISYLNTLERELNQVMRRKTKVLFMALSMCCMLLINSSYVMAANPDNNFSKMEEKS